MKSILLDTNACFVYRNGNNLVLDGPAGVDKVYMSVFVLGELFYGFEGGERSIENRHELDKFSENRRFALWTLPGRQLRCSARSRTISSEKEHLCPSTMSGSPLTASSSVPSWLR